MLGKPDLGHQCRLYKRFGDVQTAVVRLTEADARSLLGLDRLRVGSVNYRIIESFVTLVMKTRELDGRRERSNGQGQ